jgi:hypothetical protein
MVREVQYSVIRTELNFMYVIEPYFLFSKSRKQTMLTSSVPISMGSVKKELHDEDRQRVWNTWTQSLPPYYFTHLALSDV